MTEISRRRFVTLAGAVVGATVVLPRFAPTTLAHQVDLAGLGYPTLDVTVTTSSFEGIPETLAAGRYLVTANVSADVEEGGIVAFLKPYGMTAEEFLGFLGGGGEEAGGEASPEGEEGGEEEFALPAFVYQSTFAGGAGAAPGESGSVVLDLTPGEWIAWGDDPEAAQTPVVFQVTGEFPAEVTDPEADVEVTLVDFGIMVEGNLTAGEHIVRIDNQGAQPHFVELAPAPPGTTDDDFAALIMSEMNGTPSTGELTFEDLQIVTYTPTQSIDVQIWMPITLEAGTYAATCWFPTAGIGDPHAAHGMHTVFEVS